MAGIGFVLQRLSKEENLTGVLRALGHATIISAGPWLITIFMLAGIPKIGRWFLTAEQVYEFQVSVIYNFSFSLLFSTPITIITTRYLADLFYLKKPDEAIGLMVGSFFTLLVSQLPVPLIIFFGFADISIPFATVSTINYMLVSSLWLVCVFLSTLKDFSSVTQAFFFGCLAGIGSTYFLAPRYEVIGLLASFSIGLCVIIGIILARMFSEYPFGFSKPFAFLGHFIKYWDLALSSFIGTAAVWVDKWIMWFCPERDMTPLGLVVFNNYDTALFFAYLTILPSMSAFIFVIETDFFEKYVVFYQELQSQATFKQIYRNLDSMVNAFFSNAHVVFVIQFSITLLVVLSAHHIFNYLGISYLFLSMFRYGALGALFQIFAMFMIIVLSYFDNRKLVLKLQSLFFLTNAILTYISMKLGFAFYGTGFCLAMLITFVVCSIAAERYMRKLPFHTFITTNPSVNKG